MALPMAITGYGFVEQLCKALSIDVNMTRRIVLDIPRDGPVMAYVEHVVSDRILKIDWSGLRAEVKIVDKDKWQPPFARSSTI